MFKICLLCLLFLVLFYLVNRLKNKNNHLYNILNIFLITFLIEIFIFNINSFRTVFSNYNIVKYNKDDLQITGMDYNQELDIFTYVGNKARIEINNINTRIATIKLDIEIDKEPSLDYVIFYTDDTSKNFRQMPVKILADGVDRSKYTACYLSGNSERLGFELYGTNNCEVKINNIIINEKIPFNFSFTRVAVVFLTLLMIYSVINFEIFKIPYSDNNYKQKLIFNTIIVMFICLIMWINITTPLADELYEKYVNAIMNGKISLLEEPSDELKMLDNPYDATNRANVKYIWDSAFYNNTYYIYFGILPALILFIPIKLLGLTLPTFLGVLIFSVGIVLNLSNIISTLYKRWFSKLNFSYLVLSLISILSGSLIFWVNRRPKVYELAISAGVFFVTLAFHQMFKAIENKEEIKYKYLCFSSISYALAVACRPNMLLMSLCFIPIIIKVLKQNIQEKKNIAKTICLIGIPYIIVGISLMVFNYIRFDSPFEFGASYQLTVNDMKDLKNRLITIPIGIFTQLFKMPVTTNSFPFFNHQYSTIPFFGYYYIEAFVCGLFILNPINFILVFLIGLKNKIKDKEAYMYTCIFTIVSFIICIIDIALAGTIQRYSMDYAWLLNISSFLTLFIIVNNIKSIEIKKYILKISIFVTIFMFFVNIYIGGLFSENSMYEKIEPKSYYKIMYDICFWE